MSGGNPLSSVVVAGGSRPFGGGGPVRAASAGPPVQRRTTGRGLLSVGRVDFGWHPAAQAEFDRVRAQAAAWPDERPTALTRERWRRCGDAGLLGYSVPADLGGSGRGFLDTARAVEAFGLGCPDMGLVFASLAHLFACAMPIAEHGDGRVRERVLPLLASGEWVGANAITERDAGSDVTALRATARADGDHYVLDGVKTFVSNAPEADVFVVYASTSPEFGHLGVTGFVVERDTPGLVVEPFEKSVLATCPVGEVRLEGCRVPAHHVLGVPGQGAAIFQSSMRWERTCLFAAYLGQAGRLLERCVAHARERRQFGRAIGKNQAVSHAIARLHSRVEAARLLLWRACWLLDRGERAALEVAGAKLAVSEAAVDTAAFAMRVLGGTGTRLGSGVAHDLLDAMASTTFSGTSEMQLEQMAKELGL
ncbi:acyl-CoA dehydrogenase [Saccharothrix yanglingensis]|uniref:Acyl-CoA dehydrogenase n=1 Tax=Saccharothrix yanglingensis TaxID=659496 RepID=A0ABU0X3L1_9PSEU|nr:acyl-CoA dehydrogenase [Saccharothrix yanglingensis]